MMMLTLLAGSRDDFDRNRSPVQNQGTVLTDCICSHCGVSSWNLYQGDSRRRPLCPGSVFVCHADIYVANEFMLQIHFAKADF